LSNGKSQVKPPEVFNGSDPRKLKPFLVALSLVLTDHPKYYNDQRRITYTLSYLSGAAREWFEPDILDPDQLAMPIWTSSYTELVWELTENFGLYDMQGESEDKLGQLQMQENECIQKYNIKFNSLAAYTDWGESALKWAYQRGLASWIKDELARIPEPPTLAAYQREVIRIDNRYWR
jgi:hypothetical protein